VLLPGWIRSIHVVTGIAFILWKSPASDVLIETWNAVAPFRIARVIDYGDLAALVVLPLSYLYRQRPRLAPASQKAFAYMVAAVSLFAFTATSRPRRSSAGRT
jgi:hypothetical protein